MTPGFIIARFIKKRDKLRAKYLKVVAERKAAKAKAASGGAVVKYTKVSQIKKAIYTYERHIKTMTAVTEAAKEAKAEFERRMSAATKETQCLPKAEREQVEITKRMFDKLAVRADKMATSDSKKKENLTKKLAKVVKAKEERKTAKLSGEVKKSKKSGSKKRTSSGKKSGSKKSSGKKSSSGKQNNRRSSRD
jgi:adenylate kinase/ribonuclease R